MSLYDQLQHCNREEILHQVVQADICPCTTNSSTRTEKRNNYRKVPKFSDTRKRCCNLPKIKKKRQNLLIFRLKDANGIPNSEDPDQTAPLGAV